MQRPWSLEALVCVISETSLRLRSSSIGIRSIGRRTRGDLIEMYKVANEHKPIEWVNFPKLSSNLEIKGPAMGVKDNSNELPEIAVSSSSYKSSLEK